MDNIKGLPALTEDLETEVRRLKELTYQLELRLTRTEDRLNKAARMYLKLLEEIDLRTSEF